MLQDLEADFANQLLTRLDEKSSRILWCLWRYKHLPIQEICWLTRLQDMEVLQRIREIINPIAQQITGRSVLEFYTRKLDPVSGESFTFHWWLEGENLFGPIREPMVDVFDEAEHLRVMLQLPPGCNLTGEARVQLRNRIAEIRLAKEDGKWGSP